MTISTYIIHDDTQYFVEAEVGLVNDNLGVYASGFDEACVLSITAWIDGSGEQVDLEANRAFKKVCVDEVIRLADEVPRW